jgi:hypothetical protein
MSLSQYLNPFKVGQRPYYQTGNFESTTEKHRENWKIHA